MCYGEIGYATVEALPLGNYLYTWTTEPITSGDSISQDVNRNYRVDVVDQNTNCLISDTVSIPGYDNVFASFFANNTSCVSLLDGEIQFLDGSLINPNEISNNCYWDFGDGSTSIYIHGENPTHVYKDTGNFKVS